MLGWFFLIMFIFVGIPIFIADRFNLWKNDRDNQD